MRIALVSYEFAGTPRGGGIGTYVRGAAEMLHGRGHEVEVFTAGTPEEMPASAFPIHSVDATREDFAEAIVPTFAARHTSAPFDVIEGPEYGADAAGIAATFEALPLVIKLHTPSFILAEIHAAYIGRASQLRFMAGALRRGRWPTHLRAISDETGEKSVAQCADLVVGPSQAILDRVGSHWGISETRRMLVPNVFIAPRPLLLADPNTRTETVLYVGRLEVRKGVLELADAVRRVLDARPGTRFVFLGRALPMPNGTRDVKAEMMSRIGRHRDAVQFIDAVPYHEIANYFSAADICVFPSVWENFPNVCLEAMAAARGVIGSSAGGMAEMIEDGRTGLLVPPRSPAAIADRILTLLADPERRIAMGQAARAHVAASYTPDVIGPLHEASYERAIANAAGRHHPQSAA
ncbi:glycosyltransferase family 4 protein [Acuticoccus yangtzensis]|uniref:glycosyltransferase family 4 protein n=1 Tax=Acuticoccus yangtzensis TaxID=1443441 RepID=UPI000949526C|nr:glycosyltransferase family 4 protein [Acuticoccus yangtzensis]